MDFDKIRRKRRLYFLAMGGRGGAPQPFPTLAEATLIEDWTATGSESSKTFSSIPTSYNHLRLTIVGRSARAVTAAVWRLRPNNDSATTSYTVQNYNATNTTVAGGYGTTESGIAVFMPGTSYATTADAGIFQANIFFYRNTSFWKHIHSTSTYRTADTGAGTNQYEFHSQWENTGAVTSLVITDPTPGNFVSGTRMILEGF